MSFYISLDAGGSKCSAILFDEQMRLLGRGLSGGVNTNQGILPKNARAHVAECLKQLFSDCLPPQIDVLYTVFVGHVDILLDELTKYTQVLSHVRQDESAAGLVAGSLRFEGMVAIAGTGSDIFYIRTDKALCSMLGGWGPVLGDQGGGVWIGQRAVRAAVAALEGWGEKTSLYDYLQREWHLERPWDMVSVVYNSEAPLNKAASITPLVGKAANAGDAVALRIIREAGEIMAVQAGCLIKRQEIPEPFRFIVCCGGAWKTHPLMFTAFQERLHEMFDGSVTVMKPCFEHVMSGAVRVLLEQGTSPDDARRRLTEQFPDYIIRW